MDGLTLPRLHPSIPTERASAQGEARLLEELRLRCNRGHIVRTSRTTTVGAAAEATLRRFFNPRGGASERLIRVAVVLDDDAADDGYGHWDRGDVTWSIYPSEDPHWIYIGKAIAHLEQCKPGAGETVLHAVTEAAKATDGLLIPGDVGALSAMSYWDEATTDDEAKASLLERGYELEDVDSRPLLPSEFYMAAGGEMWLTPRKRLGLHAMRQALAPLGEPVAARLSRLVTVHLPTATDRAKHARRLGQASGSYDSFIAGVWRSPTGAGFAQQVADDEMNSRLEAGQSDVLFRCATAPELASTRRRAQTSAQPNKRGETGDGLAVLAHMLWVYHYLDLTLSALVDLEDTLPDPGEGNSTCES